MICRGIGLPVEIIIMNPVTPSDGYATKFPVSVKGVLVRDRRVLLLKNARGEWELPGGKLELRESPEDCLAREIFEETGLHATVGQPLRPYVYWVAELVPVLVLPFICECEGFASLRISDEHADIGTFDVSTLDSLELPSGYRLTIRDALTRDADHGAP